MNVQVILEQFLRRDARLSLLLPGERAAFISPAGK
jgi:hypothetical protein